MDLMTRGNDVCKNLAGRQNGGLLRGELGRSSGVQIWYVLNHSEIVDPSHHVCSLGVTVAISSRSFLPDLTPHGTNFIQILVLSQQAKFNTFDWVLLMPSLVSALLLCKKPPELESDYSKEMQIMKSFTRYTKPTATLYIQITPWFAPNHGRGKAPGIVDRRLSGWW
jgi:hypothetical protein